MCTVADVCGSERLQHVREKTVMETVCAFLKIKAMREIKSQST